MTEPALFNVIELLTDVPEHNQLIGSQGTIIECYGDNDFEVEFSNEDGEATAQFALSRRQPLFGSRLPNNGCRLPKKLLEF